MTSTRDMAIKIFQNLIKDPYYQKSGAKTREEVVWVEAQQSARQAHNNELALSMDASDDEFGAVKSFAAFIAKAGYDAKKIEMGEVRANAAGHLIRVDADGNEIESDFTPQPQVQRGKPVENLSQAEVLKEMAAANAKSRDDSEEDIKIYRRELASQLCIRKNQSNKSISSLAATPIIPDTKTGKSITIGKTQLPDGASLYTPKDESNKPLTYLDENGNPELDADGKEIPVVFEVPFINTISTKGHKRYKLDSHINKLSNNVEAVMASIRNWQGTADTHPMLLQASDNIGSQEWESFNHYIEDIVGRDSIDPNTEEAISKLNSAMLRFNQITELKGKQRVRDEKTGRDITRQSTSDEYIQNMKDALLAYNGAIANLETAYQNNDALDVESGDLAVSRKRTFTPTQSVELMRLWYIQQYAKSQNMFYEDGSAITPYSDFLTRFRFAPEEYMIDKDTGLVKSTGQEPDEHQQADHNKVETSTGKNVLAGTHWDNKENVLGLFNSIQQEVLDGLKDSTTPNSALLYKNMQLAANAWAPTGVTLKSSPRKPKGLGGKSEFVHSLEGVVKKRNEKRTNAKTEFKEASPARQQKKADQAEVVRAKYTQVFNRIKQAEAKSPEDLGIIPSDNSTSLEPAELEWALKNDERQEEVDAAGGVEEFMNGIRKEFMSSPGEGLDDGNHPVYELVDAMGLPLNLSLHNRLNGIYTRNIAEGRELPEPEEVEMYTTSALPAIKNRLEKIRKAPELQNFHVAAEQVSNAIDNLPALGQNPEGLLNENITSRLFTDNPDQNELIRNAIQGARYLDNMRVHVDKDGKEIKKSINFRFMIEKATGEKEPEVDKDGNETGRMVSVRKNVRHEFKKELDFPDISSLLNDWYLPLMDVVEGPAIANHIESLQEKVSDWRENFKLQIPKVDAPEEDSDEESMEEKVYNEYSDDNENILNEYDDELAPQDEASFEEDEMENEQIRENMRELYQQIEALPDDSELKNDVLGASPALVNNKWMIEWKASNFRASSEESLQELERLLNDVALDDISMDWKGIAKGVSHRGSAPKLTIKAFDAAAPEYLKKMLQDEGVDPELAEQQASEMLAALEDFAPGTSLTYKEIINKARKTSPAEVHLDEFLEKTYGPLAREAYEGNVGQFDLGDGDYTDELEPLSEDASPEDKADFRKITATRLESINTSEAIRILTEVGNQGGGTTYTRREAEEIGPMMLPALRQIAELRNEPKWDIDGYLGYPKDTFIDDDTGEKTPNEVKTFENAVKEMLVQQTGTGKPRRERSEINKLVPIFAKQLLRDFTTPHSEDEVEMFPNMILEDRGEDTVVPDIMLDHITRAFNHPITGLKSFKPVGASGSKLFSSQGLAGSGLSGTDWLMQNQDVAEAWRGIFGKDVFESYRGHRRIHNFLRDVEKMHQEREEGSSPIQVFFGADGKPVPTALQMLANDLFNLPGSVEEWEDGSKIPDNIIAEAGIEKTWDRDLINQILFSANMHGVPDYTGMRRTSRDMNATQTAQQNYYAAIAKAEDEVFVPIRDALGGLGSGKPGEDEAEFLERGFNFYDSFRERFEEKLAEQEFNGGFGLPFGKHSLFGVDDYVGKLISSLQEEIDMIPEESIFATLVQTRDRIPKSGGLISGTEGALPKIIKNLRSVFNDEWRASYNTNYWETQRGNEALSETQRNALADKWGEYVMPFDTSIKLNALSSMNRALSLRGYNNQSEYGELDADKQAELDKLRQTLNVFKGHIDTISSSDFDMAQLENSLGGLNESALNTFDDAEAAIPAFANIHQMDATSVGNAWTLFNENFVDQTITQPSENIPPNLMEYLKSPYELDEAGQPIQETDENGEPVMEPVLDEEGEETERMQPVYISKTKRVDDDATGDPADKEHYLKGADQLTKWAYSSRKYGEFTEPMAKMKEREQFLVEREKEVDEINARNTLNAKLQRGTATPEEAQEYKDAYELSEGGDVDEEKAANAYQLAQLRKAQRKQAKADAVLENNSNLSEEYEGYTEEPVGQGPRIKTHADLLEHLSSHPTFKMRQAAHPEYNADMKPRLSPDAYAHLEDAGLVTGDISLGQSGKYEWTENGQNLMNNLPKVIGAGAWQQAGIIPLKWAKTIGETVKGQQANGFFNTINAPTTPPAPTDGGEVEPLQNMLVALNDFYRGGNDLCFLTIF